MESYQSCWFSFTKFDPTQHDLVCLVVLEYTYITWGFKTHTEDGTTIVYLQGYVEMDKFQTLQDMRDKLPLFVMMLDEHSISDMETMNTGWWGRVELDSRVRGEPT